MDDWLEYVLSPLNRRFEANDSLSALVRHPVQPNCYPITKKKPRCQLANMAQRFPDVANDHFHQTIESGIEFARFV